jgi:hypothetical protein
MIALRHLSLLALAQQQHPTAQSQYLLDIPKYMGSS